MSARKEFASHKLNERGQRNAADIASAFSALLDDLENDRGCEVKSREFSIVKTKLEEACFFAKKSMAIREEMQVLP